MATTKQRRDGALSGMDKLLFWLGIGAAQKGAGSNKRTDSRHWVISLVVGILLALLIAAEELLAT